MKPGTTLHWKTAVTTDEASHPQELTHNKYLSTRIRGFTEGCGDGAGVGGGVWRGHPGGFQPHLQAPRTHAARPRQGSQRFTCTNSFHMTAVSSVRINSSPILRDEETEAHKLGNLLRFRKSESEPGVKPTILSLGASPCSPSNLEPRPVWPPGEKAAALNTSAVEASSTSSKSSSQPRAQISFHPKGQNHATRP